MISHTMSDLLALPDADDRTKARGFVERSGMVICGGLPEAEMPHAHRGRRRLQPRRAGACSSPGRTRRPGTRELDQHAEPPGRGKFLVKVGGRPGIPVHVGLTHVERGLNDTNKRWHARSRLSELDAELDAA